jgi:hypothetical protein
MDAVNLPVKVSIIGIRGVYYPRIICSVDVVFLTQISLNGMSVIVSIWVQCLKDAINLMETLETGTPVHWKMQQGCLINVVRSKDMDCATGTPVAYMTCLICFDIV